MAAVVHRQEIAPPHRAPRLAPRRRLDALLQPAGRTESCAARKAPMTHSTRFLPDLLRDALHTLEYRRKNSGAPDDPDYLLLSQGHEQDHEQARHQAQPQQHPQTHGPQSTSISPSREKVLN